MSIASWLVFVLILWFGTYALALLLALFGLRRVPEPRRYYLLALGTWLALAAGIALMQPEDGGRPLPASLLWALPTCLFWLWQHLRDHQRRQRQAAVPRPTAPGAPALKP